MPRYFGLALHDTEPNDLVHFDHLELTPSFTGARHVLTIRDDHSVYIWLYAMSRNDAGYILLTLSDSCTAFGFPKTVMFDGLYHFKNETIRLVTKDLCLLRHFTLLYCPWNNSAVEPLGKEVIYVARATLSKLKQPQNSWPSVWA